MLCVTELSFILLYTFCGIYLIQVESKYTAVFLSVNNETQYVPLFCLSSIFMRYALSFILRKLSLEKILLNLGLYLKYLVILIVLKRMEQD